MMTLLGGSWFAGKQNEIIACVVVSVSVFVCVVVVFIIFAVVTYNVSFVVDVIVFNLLHVLCVVCCCRFALYFFLCSSIRFNAFRASFVF